HFFGQRPLLWHFLDMATLETNGASNAVYKRWIPNTNFENSSNWDQGRVPCATDAILFESSKVLDLKVYDCNQSFRSIWNISLCLKTFIASENSVFIPLNGEFILAPGAGFAAFDSRSNPGCDTGTVLITFTSAENYQWYDPTLWEAATSLDNLEQGKLMFSVDEERVPCQYDDAIFQPETSFRVNIESPEQMIQLKSISIMGQKFTSDSTLAEYMQSLSGKLQFHGQGRFQLSNSRCPDKSGCQCGNAASHDRICTALLQKTGNRCPTVVCKGPLKPVGHCCEICGKHKAQALHVGYGPPKNAGVQVAISKVHKPHTSPGMGPRSSAPFIQIVLMDKTEPQTGTSAEQLAKDIMKDVAEHGNPSHSLLGAEPRPGGPAQEWVAEGQPSTMPCTAVPLAGGALAGFMHLSVVWICQASHPGFTPTDFRLCTAKIKLAALVSLGQA
uniref:Protein amnionless n=1 Tax=Varanus komodoensis TaxID=61221 RepID=A0A8D2J6T9_VARKO